MSHAVAGTCFSRTYVYCDLLIISCFLILVQSSPQLHRNPALACSCSSICFAAGQRQPHHTTAEDSGVASWSRAHAEQSIKERTLSEFHQQGETNSAKTLEGASRNSDNIHSKALSGQLHTKKINGHVYRRVAGDVRQRPPAVRGKHLQWNEEDPFTPPVKTIHSTVSLFRALVHRKSHLLGFPVSYVLPSSVCEGVTTSSKNGMCHMRFLEDRDTGSSKLPQSGDHSAILRRVYPALGQDVRVAQNNEAPPQKKALEGKYLTLHISGAHCRQKWAHRKEDRDAACPVAGSNDFLSVAAAGEYPGASVVFVDRYTFLFEGGHTKEFAVIKSRRLSLTSGTRALVRVRCEPGANPSHAQKSSLGTGLLSIGLTEWSIAPLIIASDRGALHGFAGVLSRVHCGLHAVEVQRDAVLQRVHRELRILPSETLNIVLRPRRTPTATQAHADPRLDISSLRGSQQDSAAAPKNWNSVTDFPFPQPDFAQDKEPVPLRGPWCRAGTTLVLSIDECVPTVVESSNRANCRATCEVSKQNKEHAPSTTFTYGYPPHDEGGRLVPTFLRCAKISYTTKDISMCLFKRAGFGVVSNAQLPQNEGYPVRQWETPITDCPGGTLVKKYSWNCESFERGKGYAVATGLYLDPIQYNCQFNGRRISHDRLFGMNSCQWLPPMVRTLSTSELSSSTSTPVPCPNSRTFSPQTGTGGECLPVLMFNVDDTGTHIRYYEARPFFVNTPTGESACTPYSRECSPHGMSMDMLFFTLFPQRSTQRTPGFYLPAGYDAQPHGLPVCPLGYDCETNRESWESPNPFIPLPFSLSAREPVRAYVGLTGRETATLTGQPFTDHAYQTDLLLYLPGQEFLQHCPHGYRCAGSATDALVEPLPAGVFRGRRMASGSRTNTCLPGHYCPAAAVFQIPCPRGEYAPERGQTACRIAAAGRASPSMGASMDVRCPAGHYCPVGTKHPYANPCPEHTINEQLGAADASACLPCPKGYVCGKGTGGLRRPGYCPVGHYCPGEKQPPIPCPSGTYSPVYIPSALMKSVEDCLPCPAGFTCLEGSSPNSLKSTLACPPGAYCPSGTGEQPPLCPRGTYLPAAGARSAGECLPCPQGKYCATSVEKNSKSPVQHIEKCPEGSFSINTGIYGDARRILASEWVRTPGLQLVTGTTTGRICWTTAEDLSSFQFVGKEHGTGLDGAAIEDIVEGQSLFWVVTKQSLLSSVDNLQSFEILSAGGKHSFVTYQNGFLWAGVPDTGIYVSGDLGRTFELAHADNQLKPSSLSADPGSDLLVVGQMDGSLLLTRDNFQTVQRKSVGRDPVSAVIFFEEGRVVIVASGSMLYRSGDYGASFEMVYIFPSVIKRLKRNRAGNTFVGDGNGGLHFSDSQAKVFQYFVPRFSTRTVVDFGFLHNDTLVAAGTDTLAASDDYEFWRLYRINSSECNNGITKLVVLDGAPPSTKEGTYGQCVEGELKAQTKPGAGYRNLCEPGTWRYPSLSGKCVECPAGHYCPVADTLSGVKKEVCSAGLLCPAGLAAPPSFASHPCPRGKYCPEGTTEPVPCSPGTYNPLLHQGEASACIDAPPGYYISEEGADKPSTRCPPHHYCPPASSTPTGCPQGKARPDPGGATEDDCFPCPEGYFCPNEGNEVGPKACTTGHYCPRGSVQPTPCPEGTYNPGTMLPSAETCLLCPAGKYCRGEGLKAVTGDCNAGFVCLEGAKVPSPPSDGTGYSCPQGRYCPAGTTRALPCPPGKYLPTGGAEDKNACIECPEGSYCVGGGQATPDGPCPAGYICPAGTWKPTAKKTPKGTVAPLGSHQSTDCPPGTYAPEDGMKSCWTCPAGYVCREARTVTPEKCPAGSFCPAGSSSPTACPVGTVGATQGLHSVDQCENCPPGKYCEAVGSTEPTGICAKGYYCTYGAVSATPDVAFGVSEHGGRCPAGAYCPAGAHLPTWCPPNTFQPKELQDNDKACNVCLKGHICPHKGMKAPTPCAAGTYCPPKVDGTSVLLCEKGHFCPVKSEAQVQCPEGFYQDRVLQAVCLGCPGGVRCDNVGTSVGTPCPPGKYCAREAFSAISCSVGTYNPWPGAASAFQCIRCPPGYSCDSIGLDSPTSKCPAGRWCDEGSTHSTGYHECTAGHYCPAGSVTPLPCTAGKYCDAAALESPRGACKAGYYCPPGSQSNQERPCLPGSYCPAGSTTYVLCPIGTFSDTSNATLQTACQACTAGKYCGTPGLVEPSGDCRGGFYCVKGSTVPNPPTGICQPGHQCPKGSSEQTPCTENTWQPLPMQESCEPCPVGFVCPESSIDVCKKGHYCDGAGMKKCPAGTYQPLDGQGSSTSCLTCKAGFVCKGEALTTPTERCPPGTYCTKAGSEECPEGYYCPQGSVAPVPCPPGSYCGTAGLSSPSGLCDAGHICFRASTTKNPPEDVTINACYSTLTGGVCPAGFFCPSGAVFPLMCPPGTFRSATEGTSETSCEACEAGKHCGGWGLTAASGGCIAGYYCPKGQKTATSLPCPAGSRCPKDAAAPIPCAEGTYQASEGQRVCLPCPEGYVCSASTVVPRPCPKGKYCIDGIDISCPAGTYAPFEGNWKVEHCLKCPPGKYCPGSGATDVGSAVDCKAGSYCRFGADSELPTGSYANCGEANDSCVPGRQCPSGYYCPEGSSAPLLCPPGRSGSPEGSVEDTGCEQCPIGHYCGRDDAVAMPCDPGFLCEPGSSVERPADPEAICPEKKYCPAGATSAENCGDGEFSDVEGLGACKKCPHGFLCTKGALPGADTSCDEGHYCPAGAADAAKCPRGTYLPTKYGTDKSSCLPCPPGKFCNTEGLTEFSGSCSSGYYCLSGASEQQPTADDSQTSYGQCPPGYFCAEESPLPEPCTPGTYNKNPGATASTACLQCPEGSFCGLYGLSAPQGVCAPGFHCTGSATTSRPTDATTGNMCTEGNFCAEGTSSQCPEHTYLDHKGGSLCKACPEGHFCTAGATTPQRCPPTYYCPLGRGQRPCPAGTYSDAYGLSSASECLECPASKYCDNGKIVGSCAAGFLCLLGVGPSDTPTAARPSGRTEATKLGVQLGISCPAGSYCPVGSISPARCPPGETTPNEGSTSSSACSACMAGFYCPLTDTAAIPCPRGHFCPPNSREPRPCPVATHSSKTHATSENDCEPCTAGYLCLEASVRPRSPCPYGHYCVERSIEGIPCPAGTYGRGTGAADQDTACAPCAAGFACAGAGATRQPCYPGYYCQKGTTTPLACPEGRFCPGQTIIPIDCPPGYYCPAKSAEPVPCAVGSFCVGNSAKPSACPPGTQARPRRDCENTPTETGCCAPCPAGTYSDSEGAELCEPCAAGYVCTGGATKARPTSPAEGYICPKGHYCPAGTTQPLPCPPGTINADEGAGDLLTSCLKCAPGTFSDKEAQTACSLCGGTSTSEAGDTTCICEGENRGFQRLDGTCLCKPFFEAYSLLQLAASGSIPIVTVDIDASTDCQPKVQENCEGDVRFDHPRFFGMGGSQAVRLQDGSCMTTADCAKKCGSKGGRLLAEVGSCECFDLSKRIPACDEECRKTLKSVSLRNNKLVFATSSTSMESSAVLDDITASGILRGTIKCNNENPDTGCPLAFHAVNGTGVYGLFGPTTEFESDILAVQPVSRAVARRTVSHTLLSFRQSPSIFACWMSRRLCRFSSLGRGRFQDRNHTAVAWIQPAPASSLGARPHWKTAAVASVKSPTQCLHKGDSVVWILQQGVYPVYLRDSLLNTISDFDATPFRTLASLIKMEEKTDPTVTSSLKYFAYTFNEAGQFVFGTSADTESQAIFRVMDNHSSCGTAAARGMPLQTDAKAFSAAGIKLQKELVTKPSFTNVATTVGGCILILLVLVFVMARIRAANERTTHGARQSSVNALRNADRRGKQHASSYAGIGGIGFGLQSLTYEKQKEVEAFLSHIVESDHDVDRSARVTLMDPDQIKSICLASVSRDAPIDLALFESSFRRLAHMHASLKQYFANRRAGISALHSKEIENRNLLQNALSPIVSRVEHVLQDRSELQDCLTAMCKGCEKFVDDMRAPRVFFATTVDGAAGATEGAESGSAVTPAYTLPDEFLKNVSGSMSGLAFLAQSASEVLLVLRGAGSGGKGKQTSRIPITLRVAAQYTEAVNGELQALQRELQSDPSKQSDAHVSDANVQASAADPARLELVRLCGSLQAFALKLEELLATQEKVRRCRREVLQKRYTEAEARAKICDKNDAELVTLTVQVVEKLFGTHLSKDSGTVTSKKRQRDAKSVVSVVLPLETPQARPTPGYTVDKTLSNFESRYLACIEGIERSIESHRTAEFSGLTKDESLKTRELHARHQLDLILLEQQRIYLELERTKRITAFFRNLEESKVMLIREEMKQHLHSIKQRRDQESLTDAVLQEEKNTTFQKFEARVKALREQLAAERDSTLIAITTFLSQQHEQRLAAAAEVYQAERDHLQQKFKTLRQLVDCSFNHLKEGLLQKLAARRDRFRIVATTVVDLHNKILARAFPTKNHFNDALNEATENLVGLASAQQSQENKVKEQQHLFVLQRRKEEEELLSSCAEKLRETVERSLTLSVNLNEKLLSLEEEQMLFRCLEASDAAVDTVFEARRKKVLKRIEALEESTEGKEDGVDTIATDRCTGAKIQEDKRGKELEEIEELHLKEKELQAAAVRDQFAKIKEERASVFNAMLQSQREALRMCIENVYGIKLPSDAGFGGEVATPEDESKRLLKVLDRISSFFKRLVQHSFGEQQSTQRSQDLLESAIASWPAFAEQIVRDAEEDRKIKREAANKTLRQQRRGRKKVSTGGPDGDADEYEALGDKEAAVSVLLRQADEKRQAGWAITSVLDHSAVSAYGGSTPSIIVESSSEQIVSKQCEDALRQLDATLKRAALQLRADYDADMEAIKRELAEAHASVDRHAEMDKSRVEVEMNLKAACAESDEERSAVQRESRRILEQINKDTTEEKAALEASAQEKITARTQRFQQQRKQLQDEADAEERRTRQVLKRRLAALKKEKNEAIINVCLQEARAHTNAATIKRLHEAVVAPLNESINALVAEHLEEKARRLNEITTKMRQEYENDLAAAEAEFDSQIRNLERQLAESKKEGGSAVADLRTKLEILRVSKEQALHEKEDSFSIRLEYVLQVERVAIEPPQAEELLRKQEESADEVIRILQEFVAIGDQTAASLVAQARQAKKNLEGERQNVREAAGVRLLDIHRIMKEKEEELRSKFAAALDAHKRDLELQKQREEAESHRVHQEEMKRRRGQQLARQQRQRRFLASKNRASDPQAQEELFKQHEDEARQYEEALQKDRSRQLVACQQRLQMKAARRGLSGAHAAAQKQLEEERARLAETEQLAACAEKGGAAGGGDVVDKAEEEKMYKFMFALEIESEVARRARRLHTLLADILGKLQQGDSILDESDSHLQATEDLNAVFQKLERLMEAIKNQEDSSGPV